MNEGPLHFHGTDVDPSPPEEALFHVIPVPYEKTTSYGKGTAHGPSAILEASQQLELFDGYDVPAERGIHTYAPISCEDEPGTVLDAIASRVGRVATLGKLPILLGGEHTVTLGAIRGLQATGVDVGIVQFDAHADLRASYEGDSLSHACVMRRIHELKRPIAQIGVRALCLAEHEFRSEERIPHLDADQIAKGSTADKLLPPSFPEHIYITFDVDAFDLSIMPATGTPEPGGLTWYKALELLTAIAKGRNIVGFDVVELAPIAGLHACEFTVAKLAYNLMGLAARSRET